MVTSSSSSRLRPRNGPPLAVSDDAAEPIHGDGPEALVHGAVLRVHRNDLGPRRRSHPLDHRTGRDERLLVGQGQAAPGQERGDGDRQPGEADDPVDHDVGVAGDLREGLRAGEDLGAGRYPLGELASQGRIGDGDLVGTELDRLLDQPVDRRGGAEGDDPVVLRLGPDDIDSLGADRSRRTYKTDRLHAALPSQPPTPAEVT